MNQTILSNQEKASLLLRDLYNRHGYSQYKMSKFEEYDLYSANKDFLISEGIITFTDTNGKLMALKPDVTLSIIRSNADKPQKLWYNENVYRLSGSTHNFKEIMQVGLECLGKIDTWSRYEVLQLAIESLLSISDECVLSLCHLGIVSHVLDSLDLTGKTKRQIINCIASRNAHQLAKLTDNPVLLALTSLYGTIDEVIPQLDQLLPESVALDHFKQVLKLFKGSELEKYIRIDFSVISDMTYYNGLVFKGYVKGIPNTVLSGGQYDKLMSKMKHKIGALGFAVYLDELERFHEENKSYDFDYAVIYDDASDLMTVQQLKQQLSLQGSVIVCQQLPEHIQIGKTYIIKGKEVCENA